MSRVKKPISKKCTRRDCKDLTKEAREIAHRDFWAMGDYNDQNAYLLTLISSKEKQVTKMKKEGVTSRPKSKTRCYKVNGIEVCKEVFSVSKGRLGRLFQLVLTRRRISANDFS